MNKKKETGGSTHTKILIDSDPTGEYPSESSSTSFLNKSIGSPMSIRVPDAEVQPHSTYSGDEESSDDEELPKQTWRADSTWRNSSERCRCINHFLSQTTCTKLYAHLVSWQ